MDKTYIIIDHLLYCTKEYEKIAQNQNIHLTLWDEYFISLLQANEFFVGFNPDNSLILEELDILLPPNTKPTELFFIRMDNILVEIEGGGLGSDRLSLREYLNKYCSSDNIKHYILRYTK